MRLAIDSLAGNWALRGPVFVLGLTLFWTTGCSTPQKSAEPQPISISSSPAPAFPALAQATATPSQTSTTPSPVGAEEIAQALARIFDKSATVDDHRSPAFVVGDFNGDGAQDLAVITRTSETALPEINNELANWTLEDPHDVANPAQPNAPGARTKTVKAGANDQLLAIIHGVGQAGWRNPEARQTFLLKNVAGTEVAVQAAARMREMSSGTNVVPRGDAITSTFKGRRGLIFWTGAKYAWAPQR